VSDLIKLSMDLNQWAADGKNATIEQFHLMIQESF